MQYVGKFVSTVYNTITPNINPATLSGAIDVIVVERTVNVEEQVEVDAQGNVLSESEQGKLPEHERKYKTVKRQTTELASTPFHVRFGKMSVLRPGERKVTLHLNNSTDPLPFAMKVSDSGEAFFVLEIDDEDERNNIPDDLVTSPILSAASSPITSPEDGGDADTDAASAEVEPLELGDAEQLPASSFDSDAVAVEQDQHINSSDKLEQNKQSGQPDDQGDLNVPHDSTKTGSGAAAGSDSLLNKVGSAASKASGVLGAAGRAVMSGSNPRLDKTAERAQHSDGTDNMTGAPVDQDRGDAHHYEPEQGGPQGKERQEAQDEATESSTQGQPQNETERLEAELQQKAMEVVEDEVLSEHDNESILSIDSAEEAYPAPFGASGDAAKKSKTKSVASSRHSEYLGGKRLKPVPIGDGNRTLDPAMTDASTHIYRHEQRQQQRKSSGDVDEDFDEDTAVDDDDEDEHDHHSDDEIIGTVKVKQRKEDLQYMLDMDGYKMTPDGEDLAYREGHRFADEMPLGRRHGGNGRHVELEIMVEKNIWTTSSDEYKRVAKIVEECHKDLDKGGLREIGRCDEILQTIIASTTAKQPGSSGYTCINVYDVRLSDSAPACGMNWPTTLSAMYDYLHRPDVRKALHVDENHKPEAWVECNSNVGSAMRTDTTSPPSVQLLPDLLASGVKVLLFAGEEDLICNAIGVRRAADNLEWNGSKGFGDDHPAKDWYVNGSLAGSWRTARNLTYVGIKGGSHMVGVDKPIESHDMMVRFMGIDYMKVAGPNALIPSRVGDEPDRILVTGGGGGVAEIGKDGSRVIPGSGKTEEQVAEEARWRAYYDAGSFALMILVIAVGVGTWLLLRSRKRRRMDRNRIGRGGALRLATTTEFGGASADSTPAGNGDNHELERLVGGKHTEEDDDVEEAVFDVGDEDLSDSDGENKNPRAGAQR